MRQDDPPKFATLQDIAKALGVSRTTVSNAFNRPDQLSPELRQKVLNAATEMGYPGPNPMARMLRTGQSGAIGVVFSESLLYAFSDPVAIAFLQGVASVCEQAKASLLIVPAMKSSTAKETVLQAAVDGFIVYCTPDNDEATARVLERKLPTVAVDRPGLKGVPSIGIDDRQSAREAADHLIRLNHRRLAIVSMELQTDQYEGPVDAQRLQQSVYPNARDRLLGYCDAMQTAGLQAEPIIEECLNREGSAFKAALRIFNQQPRPTGILAMSDRLAVGVLQAAEVLGLKVPEEVSIVGFDDIPLASQVRPRLTTIRQPLIEKGAIAAKLLLGKPEQATYQTLKTELVIRESSGPAPIES